MYYRLDSDGSVLDYSRSKFSEDCLYTDKELVKGWDGNLYVDGTAPTPPADKRVEALNMLYAKPIQEYLDKVAVARGYDSCLAACSYINTGVRKFDAEGAAFRKWRSAVWDSFYDMLVELEDPAVSTPTIEQVLEKLPKLSMMYE